MIFYFDLFMYLFHFLILGCVNFFPIRFVYVIKIFYLILMLRVSRIKSINFSIKKVWSFQIGYWELRPFAFSVILLLFICSPAFLLTLFSRTFHVNKLKTMHVHLSPLLSLFFFFLFFFLLSFILKISQQWHTPQRHMSIYIYMMNEYN